MKTLALYIHWPFCVSKCPYCDFNSHVRNQIDIHQWETALLSELDYTRSQTGPRTLTSIFFGGGTPSLMPASLISSLINRATGLYDVDSNLEITCEANPSSVEREKFLDLKTAGVNRLSLGVQSFDPGALRFLGRAHSVTEAADALDTAFSIFDRVSFDLIYALPNQTTSEWETALKRALSYNPAHLSLYQLTIEPGTVFETKVKRGDIIMPPEETSLALYLLTQEMMGFSGLPAYEVSNHARIGQESRHNLTYWNYGDYAGIGPGAHGRLRINGGKFATQTHKLPEKWLSHVSQHGHGYLNHTPLNQNDQFEEALMMGLRLKNGITWAHLASFDIHQTDRLQKSQALAHLVDEGYIKQTPQGISPTPQGRLTLTSVTGYLLQ